MIKGKQIQPRNYVDKPNLDYRKLDALNQTMLKIFDNDPVRFYEEFKLGKKRRQKENLALDIGNLVDFYLLACKGDEVEFENRMEEKFVMATNKGSGQVFVLADHLFDEAVSSMDETNTLKVSFETIFSSAVAKAKDEGKYKGKDEDKILEDFEKNGMDYYKKKLDNIGKIVVDIVTVNKAKAIAQSMLTDDFTKDIFTCCKEDVEYHTHFPIEWKFILNATDYITCKSELDMLFVDHDKKIITPMDLKTTYDNESFDIGYLKNGYYLQNAFYNKGLKEWAKDNGYESYTIEPMSFIVGDTSSNNRRPLVYLTSNIDIANGMYGFTIRGVKYRGVEELVEDINWAEKNDMWTCSREALRNKGKMKLKIDYDG